MTVILKSVLYNKFCWKFNIVSFTEVVIYFVVYIISSIVPVFWVNYIKINATSMHSSGMRTARLLTVSQHALCRGCVSQHALGRGVCVPACTGQGGCVPACTGQGGCIPACTGWGCVSQHALGRGVSAWGVIARGVSARGGVSAWGWGVYPGGACLGGVYQGVVSAGEGSVCQGWCLPRGSAIGCMLGGVADTPPRDQRQTPPLWIEWLTDRCKNITLPQLRCGW